MFTSFRRAHIRDNSERDNFEKDSLKPQRDNSETVPFERDNCIIVLFERDNSSATESWMLNNPNRPKVLTHNIANNGIFLLDDETNKRIDGVNFHGATGQLQAKQLHMLGYLWELAYDLCIAPGSNMSGNPGFEVPLGICSTNCI